MGQTQKVPAITTLNMAPLFSRVFVLSMLMFSVVADSEDSPHKQSIPAIPPAIVALAFFGLSFLIHLIHSFRFGPPRPFMLTLLIGMAMMIGGFATRILSANSTSQGIRTTTTILILLAPSLFLALSYMILGRLAGMLGPDVASRTMFIRPTRVATIFVWSDVATFLIQALGGVLLTSKTVNTAMTGKDILLAGLLLQLTSFGLFIGLAFVFGVRLRKHFPHLWQANSGKPDFAFLGRDFVSDWKVLYYTLSITCVALMIRSVFRVVEFASGFNSVLSTDEVYEYFLDTLPVWFAVTMYCLVWPPRFLALPGESTLELKRLSPPSHVTE
ncbi:RTA1 like protein-domain-containing protein [Mycena alexandri]|uniref:RTA1 like protein-domain-containing protein n=1 Tax=Mycena alexandri TaxID=1745969 RepID=A0AAD6SE98_9AGAR|nr:RTA1 like protein-domain-containing protein [Mycena alexandri]